MHESTTDGPGTGGADLRTYAGMEVFLKGLKALDAGIEVFLKGHKALDAGMELFLKGHKALTQAWRYFSKDSRH
jgi:hypothetical protein